MLKDSDHDERLHFAVQQGNLEEVRRLIEEGSDVSGADETLNLTPLHYAVQGGELAIAKLLLECGADVNSRHAESIGDTPLGLVAASCSFEVAKLLVEFGADPTIPGWMQLTALDRAAKRKRQEGKRVFELLREAAKL